MSQSAPIRDSSCRSELFNLVGRNSGERVFGLEQSGDRRAVFVRVGMQPRTISTSGSLISHRVLHSWRPFATNLNL
jgi:hypothetical protein